MTSLDNPKQNRHNILVQKGGTKMDRVTETPPQTPIRLVGFPEKPQETDPNGSQNPAEKKDGEFDAKMAQLAEQAGLKTRDQRKP